MSQENANQEAEQLWRIRHSAAHVMATAIQEMFPDAKFAIGPPIQDGFYYDFDLPRPLSTEDLEEIEKRMKKVVKENQKFEREQWSKDKAREFFADQPYKLELIDGIEDEEVSIYINGPFTDLCAGPHVPRTKQCKHFKLTKVAGAYWRGDEKRPMLQRIYGTAWKTRDELDDYLHMLEEAKRRDHRRLARELELFDFNKLAPGQIFWKPKGWTAYRELQNYFRELEQAHGYIEICNPILYNKELFEKSGHWEHYKENMFILQNGDETHCLKPMNCPDTMVFFGSRKRSYRELPMRVAEFGMLHRNELAGALSGATRVRQFCQDDAHIFATEDQINGEIALMLELVDKTYGLFGVDYHLEFSTRPEDFMGEVAQWDSAEAALKTALDASGREYKINEGDGAFYGPKIDIHLRDGLGRSWQCATIQLDFQLPQRFELKYTDSDNVEKTPIVIHRAIAGSLERFFAILVEHFAGAFPTWMAPVQARIMTITDDQADYAWEVAGKLKAAGIRVEVDDRGEKVNKKIAEAEVAKIPYMAVIGGREAENGNVALRTYAEGRRGVVSVEEFVSEMVEKISTRALDAKVLENRLAQRQAELGDEDAGEEMEDRGY
jgi:threonyl-tRNA synthetase